MKRNHSLFLAAAVTALLAACTSTPKSIAELETARAVVPQVESSPRVGVAAAQVAEARKSLDRANRLADSGAKLDEIKFEANVAARHAQIANEKILTAQAKEEIDKGTAQRQAVLLEARERENQRRTQQAQMSAEDAELAKQKAASLEKELADLKGKQTERGLVITLGDVLFDTGLSTLKPGAYSTVDKLATALKDSPDRKVVIEGHTDSVGSDQYNQELSQRRAQAVQAALQERGVNSSQISAYGKGETFPVASNDNPSGRQQNRRVELVFENSKGKDGGA
jgi:outer membrane protein OmpA-like peptidoglycan-associated protein